MMISTHFAWRGQRCHLKYAGGLLRWPRVESCEKPVDLYRSLIHSGEAGLITCKRARRA